MNFLIRPFSWLLGLLDIVYYVLFLKPGNKGKKFYEEGYGDVNATMALRESIRGTFAPAGRVTSSTAPLSCCQPVRDNA